MDANRLFFIPVIQLPLPPLADTSSVMRHPTTVRKSEQAKNTRSHSVPSLHSIDTSQHSSSPSRKPRSNSVRATGSSKLSSKSLKSKLARILGSHSDLSDRGGAASEQQRSGTYRPLGTGRPRSIGGSSDCSSSSLTSGPHHSDFSRHNSLRGSKISQNSVFSSRQASCDSADALSYTFHGAVGITALVSPAESGHRPKSIACMQRSGSNSSLKNSTLHSITDPRYHSLAALPPRVDVAEPLFVNTAEERTPSHRPIRGGLHRGPTLPDEPESPLEGSETVLPSDPDYRKVAENLMTCSPQPRLNEELRLVHQPTPEAYGESAKKSSDELTEEVVAGRPLAHTSSSGSHTLIRGQDIRHPHSPSQSLSLSLSLSFSLSLTHTLSLFPSPLNDGD